MHEIWLVRHGETEWSLSGQHTGRTDIALTPNGEAQARSLRDRLSGLTFAQVLSSPLQRARRTAELAGFPQPELCDELMEWDYGAYEGRTSAQIRETAPGWTIWDGAIPRGESAAQVAERTRVVLQRCLGDRVLLFAHGHLLRVLAATWLGLPPRDGRLFALTTASVSVLGLEHDTPVLLRWNQ